MTTPTCPKCNSEIVVDITYGYPAPGAYEDNSFYSGGCCMSDESPAHHCKSCGNDFGTVDLSGNDDE